MFNDEDIVKLAIGKSFSNKTYKDLKKCSQYFPRHPGNPGRHISSIIEVIKKDYDPLFKRRYGGVLEHVGINTIAEFINSDKRKIPLFQLKCNKQSIVDHLDWVGHKVDVDLLVNEHTAFFMKMSFRERWKQADRDALILPANIKKVIMFWKEHDTDTIQQTLDLEKKIQDSLISDAEVVTVYNEEHMYNIFNNLIEEN